MSELNIKEKIIVDITTDGKENCNTARLVIDESETQGTSLISPAILQMEVDGQTAELHMTADELGKIARMFLDKVQDMK